MFERFEALTYIDKEEGAQYSKTPRGTLDVTRLLDNKSSWKISATTNLRKKKTLIINDWLSKGLKTFGDLHKKLIDQLLHEGFTIYFWCEEELQSLNAENLNALISNYMTDSLSFQTYTDFSSQRDTQKIISTASSQYQLTRDQIEIIDPFWMAYLMNVGPKPPTKTLTILLDEYLEPTTFKAAALQLVQYFHVKLVYSRITIDSCELLSAIRGLPNIEVIEAPKKLQVHDSNAETCIKLIESEKTNFLIYTFTIPRDKFLGIDTLIIEDPYSQASFDLLKCMKNIKSLEVDSAGYVHDKARKSTQPKFDNYVNITSLSIRVFKNEDYILSLINACPNASKIKIEAPVSRGFIAKLTTPQKQAIEHMRFKGEGSIEQDVASLAQLSGLRAFSIPKYQEKNKETTNLPLLNHIESIDASYETDPADIRRFLQHTPHLKHLTIEFGIEYVLDTAYFNTVKLPDLEHIDFWNIEKVSLAFLNQPHLRSAELGYLIELKQLQHFENLRELTLDMCIAEDNSEEFKRLFGLYSKLKKISFKSCEFPKNFTQHLKTSTAIKVDFNYCDITPKDAQYFFTKCKTIKWLSFCRIHDGRRFPPDLNQAQLFDIDISLKLNIEELEYLDLTDYQLTETCIEQILSQAPKLKNLILWEHSFAFIAKKKGIDDCKNYGNKLLQTLKQKYHLEHLSVYWCVKYQHKTHKTHHSSRTSTNNHISGKYSNGNGLSYYAPNESRHIDADTSLDKNKQFNVRHYYFCVVNTTPKPDFMLYRMVISQEIKANPNHCSMDEAFQVVGCPKNHSIKKIDAHPSLKEDVLKKAQEDKTHNYYYGQVPLSLSTSWQPLPSLSAHEEIISYQGRDELKHVEWSYCQAESLYYVRVSDGAPKNLLLDFLVKVPKVAPTPELDKNLKEYIQKLKAFNDMSALKLPNKNQTGEDYQKALEAQKKGACRHRAALLMMFLKQNYPKIPARYVTNECHAFVEVHINGAWHTYDLGGYPAKVNLINPSDAFDNKKQLDDNYKVSDSHPIKSDLPNNDQTTMSDLFTTWGQKKQTYNGPQDYFRHLFAEQKYLVKTQSRSSLKQHLQAITRYCKDTHKPYFYIDDPDDLVCSSPYLKKEGDTGVITNGPGGNFYDFIEAHRNNQSVLLVNYDTFSADDLVRLNSLIDKDPRADGVALGEKTKIIGVIDTSKPDCYQGSDFYSRFDKHEFSPLDETSLHEYVKKYELPLVEKTDSESKIIDLFKSSDWKERLLGQWMINKDQFNYKEGPLLEALSKGLSIELKNAPWHLDEFQNFWEQALLHGVFKHGGQLFKCPETFKLLKSEGYDFKALSCKLKIVEKSDDQAFVLNPGRMHELFGKFTCEKPYLMSTPGYIEQHPGQTIKITLTRALDEHQWAMILSECHRFNVTLDVHMKAETHLPEPLAKELKSLKQQATAKDWGGLLEPGLCCIESTDPDTTLAQLKDKEPNLLIVDISEMHADDLLLKTKSHFDAKTCKLAFEQQEGFLLKELECNTKVVLTGHFSADLLDAISPILLKHPDKIILVSDKPTIAWGNYYHHQVSTKEKQQAAKVEDPNVLSDTHWSKESLSQIKTRLRYLSQNKSSEEAWQGLHRIEPSTHLKPFDEKQSQSIASQFIQKRLEAVQELLKQAPYVYLSGISGVGKTTFVERYLATQKDKKLFWGEEAMTQWAQDASEGQQKILFIDEANMSSRAWSECEGLYQDPPFIIIQGVKYALSPEHKLIFAGNPVSYGDARHLAPFFMRHGNALVFEPMPAEFIYEELLKPIFKKSAYKSQSARLSRVILRFYSYLCEQSQQELLITPRELQMMALLTISQYSDPMTIEDILYKNCRDMTKSLLPESKTTLFEKKFPAVPLKQRPIQLQSTDFYLTPSRQPLARKLKELLLLREYRLDAKKDIIKYGGLGGTIIEGGPGIGKTELVLAMLREYEYEEVHYPKPHSCERPFYRMPVGMDIDEKKKLLLQAFHQGAVVCVDEINSSPMMERFLNDLLMGYEPGTKKRPQKPGFMLIGTQNPSTMAGRKAASTALKRRLITTWLPEYEHEELVSIQVYKGLNKETATQLVAGYTKALTQAKKEDKSPLPNFRTLNREVDRLIKVQPSTEKPQMNVQERNGIFEDIWEQTDAMDTEWESIFDDKKNESRQEESSSDKKRNPPVTPDNELIQKIMNSPEYKRLEHTLDELTSYADRLEKETKNHEEPSAELGKQKAKCARALSTELKDDLNNYINTPRESFTQKEHDDFTKSFIDKLHRHDELFKNHRYYYKVIIANIVLAMASLALVLSVIGLPILGGVMAYSYSKRSSVNFFYSQTQGEQVIEDIHRKMDDFEP